MLGELILAHFVGDFVLQNDAMAQRKKTSHYWCSVHVLTYLMPFLLTGIGFWPLLLIGVQHWLQDRYGFVQWFMKQTGSEEFTKPPFAPWSIFVVDGIFHVVFIVFVHNLFY